MAKKKKTLITSKEIYLMILAKSLMSSVGESGKQLPCPFTENNSSRPPLVSVCKVLFEKEAIAG